MKYLISAASCKLATALAKDKGFKGDEWVYIPWDKHERQRRIKGRRVKKDHLIGHFTDEEINYLTAWEA